MKLEEVANVMGITRERVRQIEKKAILKLKKACFRHGLKPEDLFCVWPGLKMRRGRLDYEPGDNE